MKVDILGEKYEIITIKKNDPRYNHCDGYCDETIKTIGVKEYTHEGDVLDKGDLGKQHRKSKKHH